MRRPASEPALPGSVLLRLARLLFDPVVIEQVVLPTIGDLQREVVAAGSDRAARRQALWRGYGAFWKLVLLSPATFGAPARRPRLGSAFPEVAERIAFALIGLTVLSSVLRIGGPWTIAPALASGIVAITLHRWWCRHPSRIALPDRSRTPEINLSSIPVGGDIGGLIFVVGSVLIVTAGIPMVRWFLVGVVLGGMALALGLTRWHAAHASDSTATTIIAR